MHGALSKLLQPISAENPCGADLEDTQLLASFDAYRLFGQSAPLSEETDWREIRDRALEAIETSKDFRLLAHVSSALLRAEGLAGFVDTLKVASHWLETWPAEVFPRVDEDAILRRNALNGFADRMAIVDGLRRAPLLVHRQLGPLSIRDIEIATNQIAPVEGEAASIDATQLVAHLSTTEVEELNALSAQLNDAIQSLTSIEDAMRSAGGVQAAPDFGNLTSPLKRTLKLVTEHLSTRAPASIAASEAQSEDASAGGVASGTVGVAVGGIRSREDATRALDAVADFFRTNEPSSPVPLLIERAKRLVGKDFLAMLEELAPDALDQAKAASGVRDNTD
ncbi:type VI secretion system protein TssA [Steroidobacter sp. S1-65]|uniref:Type VI secretion system protein TssA n=1 Tax=Steroidobacter gossypii TaxID=2805490 RepID=A0ABS1X0G3_9GAMM|nr:type VI secretion system protein TssA [Steroidobacter gossypii]MBM0106734.1 type VI secretion system protein TssA [Steroidobacter gossypii]